MKDIHDRLMRGQETLGLELTTEQQDKLLAYVTLLIKWSKAYNLTAIKREEDIIDRHLLDSLAIVPFLKGGRFIDVGTGAGLPGVPLAILRPDHKIDLLDSNGKKTRFLIQVCSELGLDNIEVIASRAETYKPALGYDGVLSRAFANLLEMIENTHHLCSQDGCFYAMKGLYPSAEIDDLDAGIHVTTVHQLSIPGIDEARHLVVATIDDTYRPKRQRRLV
ncbi:MAG: 16S rRNA (guanine(527)-N(7))-methyltransferase RsmG [Halieaceae bacterium]|jgi:16S rRNA (guanine(527)-N(7))-methyltransferase RsmG